MQIHYQFRGGSLDGGVHETPHPIPPGSEWRHAIRPEIFHGASPHVPLTKEIYLAGPPTEILDPQGYGTGLYEAEFAFDGYE